MKLVAQLFACMMLIGLIPKTGCYRIYKLDEDWEWGAPPAYSANERYQQIARNWDYEGKQIVDDSDHLLLLRRAGQLALWMVR